MIGPCKHVSQQPLRYGNKTNHFPDYATMKQGYISYYF